MSIRARYAGTCQTCGKGFGPGDEIVGTERVIKSRSGWKHLDCNGKGWDVALSPSELEQQARAAYVREIIATAWRGPATDVQGPRPVMHFDKLVTIVRYVTRLPKAIGLRSSSIRSTRG